MTTRLSLKDMPTEERPLYRIEHFGPGALSNSELLQIVANVNYADICPALLAQTNGDGLSGIAKMSTTEISDIDGLGPVTAKRIKAALELGRRMFLETAPDRLVVRRPADAAQQLMATYGNEDHEHFAVVSLDTRNRVLAIDTIYRGTVNAIITRVAEIFQAALKRGAVSIIVCHNHPSGDPTPSREDVRLTENLVQAGKIMNIEVLDHLIVTHSRFVSLKERGLGFR